MRLSVIIVSYNVYPFLDNCLRSVRQALAGIDGEIIVIDNASVDRTPQLIQEHFPDVQLIANTDNRGFAKANNQALAVAQGEYVLLLNPDTIVSGDTFSTSLEFMDTHPDAGAVGVRMIDGSGQYLPESKRGLPTLLSSFMKMSGLYKILPRSAKWNRYYQGHIGEYETAKIEVLSGAYMFIRKSVLDHIGFLDEAFFMYGEDIDLSYRITKNGHAIYYLPTTDIIHYKGESTKKSSLNYFLTFYQAMLIFTQKHPEFSGQQFLIRWAIYVHGIWRYIRQVFTRWWPVMMDILLIAGSFWIISAFWSRYYYDQPGYFTPAFYQINIPLYTAILMLSMWLNGAYDRPFSRGSSWMGFLSGTIMILVVYAFLPTTMRTSRMVIGLGSILYALLLILSRWKLTPWNLSARSQHDPAVRKAIIVAGPEESSRIRELINRSRDHIEIMGTVSPDDVPASKDTGVLGSIDQMDDIVRVHQVKEIIFSAQDVPFSEFTGSMTRLGPSLRYMLAASTTMNIVGSMNRDTEGESYAIRIHFNLSSPAVRRAKRLFDFISSVLILLLFPVLAFLTPHAGNAFQCLLRVLTGRWTWVAYHPMDPLVASLPKVKQGVLHPAYPADEADVHRRLRHIHYVYARDYHWTTDLSILIRQWKKTGENIHGYAQ